jgi:multidrug resistance efflux pump
VKKIFLIAAIIVLGSTATSAQEPDIEKLTKNTDLLRQLYSEGLIARIELEKAEQQLTAAKTRAEETQKAQELAKKADSSSQPA